ncbi:MAG: PorV/PorQ family protein [bacterium]|nr:PorV/PorQ family protein [bacterium]
MTRKTPIAVTLLSVVLVLLVALPGSAWAGNPGEAGMLFLRMGVGAREAGMGETGVASSRGAAAVWWNPANNVFADFETSLVLQHHRYLGLFNQEAAAVAHRIGPGVVGVMFTGLFSDTIDRYSAEPVGRVEGSFKPYDIAFGLSYAHPLGDRFAVSATGKFVYERIDRDSASGLAFDLGISHVALIDGLVFGAAVTNLGGRLTMEDEPFDLPRTIRAGAAWTPPAVAGGKVTLAGDVLFPRDGTEKAHVGAEYRMLPEFSLRLGSRVNYESQGLTAGAGFRTGRLGVDYAYSDMTTDGFNDGHKFSLGFVW